VPQAIAPQRIKYRRMVSTIRSGAVLQKPHWLRQISLWGCIF
jgi:hypothetical protein